MTAPLIQVYGGEGWNGYPVGAPGAYLSNSFGDEGVTFSITSDPSGLFDVLGGVVLTTALQADDTSYPIVLQATHDGDTTNHTITINYTPRPTGALNNDKLGYNLPWLHTFTYDRIALDLVKYSHKTQFNRFTNLALTPAEEAFRDSEGWFTSFPVSMPTGVKILLFENGDFTHMAGDYVLYWEGEGTYRIGADDFDTSTGTSGVTEYYYNGTGANLYLYLKTLASGNPLRKFKMVPKEHKALFEAGEVLHPEFKRKAQNSNVLRFMDSLQINTTVATTFADRGQYDYVTWSNDFGFPWEFVTRIVTDSNGAKAWINIPGRFTDQAILDLMNFLNANLDSSTKFIFEDANEPWNSLFQVYKDYRLNPCPCAELTDKMVDGSEPYNWILPRIGYRSAHIGVIANQIFGIKR